jgi:hypothetical protein
MVTRRPTSSREGFTPHSPAVQALEALAVAAELEGSVARVQPAVRLLHGRRVDDVVDQAVEIMGQGAVEAMVVG